MPAGVVRLHTVPALVALDVMACVATGVVVDTALSSYVPQAALTLAAFACLRLYRSRLSLSVLDDLPRMLGGVLIGYLAFVGLAVQGWITGPESQGVTSAALLLPALTGSRALCFTLAGRVRRSGRMRDLALIIGAGNVGIQLGENLRDHRDLGVTPVGYIDSNPRVADGHQLPAPLLGGYEQLAGIIEDYNVAYVMVAFGAAREAALVDILRTCDRLDVEVLIVPRLFELHNTNRDGDDIWGIPLIRVRRAAFRSPWWRLKRLMDVTVAAVALVALAPVLAACALAVRHETGPGVIFRQVRVGLDQRPFELLKFRSLRPSIDGESQTRWSIAQDPRLGPVGRFLRRSSLDELPQLWNILRGDMSLVGPRPERPHFVKQFSTHIPRYTARHRVPAGLTGWAQIHGLRGDTSIEHRAKFDNYYIENWSPWLDVKILLRTAGQVFRRRAG